MKMRNKIYLTAVVLNVALLAGEWISFAVWASFAVRAEINSSVFWFLVAPIILSIVAIAFMIYNSRLVSAGKIADSNTLHVAIFIVNAVNIALTNIYFAMVLGVANMKVEKIISFLLVGIYYLLDIVFLLMSKGYVNALNNYYDVENDKELGKKIGKIVGLSLFISNTIMLALSISISSVILTISICPVNTVVIIATMIATESKYGKKKYL